jgi:signal transduction histidine kinase
MSNATSDPPAIRVGAHVLVQLGEELVTDVEQAILECVKNAYDADSPGCSIRVDTRASGVVTHQGKARDLASFHFSSENVSVRFTDDKGVPLKVSAKGVPLKIDPDAEIIRELHWTGSIEIEDNGDGISPNGLRSSWLVISNSEKRVANGKKVRTKKGRTPLGDKGLGRLGSMKLGDILLVESAQSTEDPIASAMFRWSDTDAAQTVDQIPVRVLEKIPNARKFKGTRVSVLGLREIEQWSRSTRAFEITKSLARLISPFEAKSQFPVKIDVDDQKTTLVAVTDTLLGRAMAEFLFRWECDEDGNRVLECRARFKEKLFRPTNSAKQQEKADAVFGDDGGDAFLSWLAQQKKFKRYLLTPRPNKDWFVELHQKFTWEEIVSSEGGAISDPGALAGAFYYFHLNELNEEQNSDDNPDLDTSSVAGLGVDRGMIKEMAGVSILRDGFRVRSGGDWLKMSEGMTSGSTYNLRYHNTLGYFSLSGEENPGLVEKSDREGFVDNAPYRGFMTVAETCKFFANEAIEDVRRGQDKYTAEKIKRDHSTVITPERSISIVDESIALAALAHDGVNELLQDLNDGIAVFEKRVAGVPVTRENAVKTLKGALESASALQKSLSKSARASTAVKVLRNEMSDSKERMLSLYESAAVGLSARGLAHELRTHLIEIRKRATAIENVLKDDSTPSASAMPHVRAIRASCGSISNAASLIDPMLPRARALKERLDLRSFIGEYIDHRQHGLDQEKIAFRLIEESPCVIKINRGRLLQVIDNLMRNSVYWLRRGVETMHISREKEIVVTITGSGFSLADSGPGIDTKYEDSVFEMFVSAKPATERGQGLGLFIVTQLLAADGAEIYLAQDRNANGRRFKFIVNLSSVVER